MAQAVSKEITIEQEVAKLRSQLQVHENDIKAVIPKHWTVEKFFGLITNAIIRNPDLLRADRLTLIQAALDCANDGLKPDNREGAFVVFETKYQEDGKWFKVLKAQWMPMIRGIYAKLHNTGLIKSVKAEPVYSKDRFRAWADDDGEHIEFEAARGERGKLETYFAAIWMKDGTPFVEVMTPADVEKIRNVSKSKDNANGPWQQWPEEMAKKTIVKRLSKRAPLSAEIERLMARDDDFFLQTLKDVTPGEEAAPRPKGIGARMAALADNRGVGTVDMGAGQGEKEPAQPRQQNSRQETRPAGNAEPTPMDPEGAYDRGVADKAAGKASMAMPKEYRSEENDGLMQAWQRGFKGLPFNNEDEGDNN